MNSNENPTGAPTPFGLLERINLPMSITENVASRQLTIGLTAGRTAVAADEIVRHLKACGSPIVRSWRGFLYIPNRHPARVNAAELASVVESHCTVTKNGEIIDIPDKLVRALAASSVWEVIR
ncbi:hypothetical protein [Rhizobium leguminosarum]|nr:hypothetical protein [Rhizobium leguminosarum]NEI61404.1 hypothetical protein [Rhizobium leguminosarum]